MTEPQDPDDRDTVEAPTTPASGPAGQGSLRGAASREAPFAHPEVVGPFEVRSLLGEGGMGAVYLAWQSEPVQREVALKLIKLGMDTREVVARFDAERQVLAVMSHPNIAQVYDAGATDVGRPYFVMEYVAGVSIDKYCDREALPIEDRLRLFQQICDGIQHAHQKGIIHRDLKPSNVLVTAEEQGSIPKIIDFGIAKATGPDTDLGMTGEGVMIGTPEYMSPEQASGSVRAMDTRSDIYSLGVLLYELLVGTVPFDPRELRDLGPVELRDWIQRQEPPRPSVRLEATKDPDEVARRRATDRSSLVRALRADLDWIALRALEKDPERRYASASEFAADIGRFLSDETVLASPPTVVYRLTKFVRRNKVSVAAGSAIVATLIVALVLSLNWYGTAEEARSAEVEARRELETTLDGARRSLGALFLEKADRALVETNFAAAASFAAQSIQEYESGEARTVLDRAWRSAHHRGWTRDCSADTAWQVNTQGDSIAFVAESGESRKLVVVDAADGTTRFEVPYVDDYPFGFSKDSLYVFAERLYGWTLADGEPLNDLGSPKWKLRHAHGWLVSAPDGQRVMTHRRGSTSVWDTEKLETLCVLENAENDPRSVSPDGRFLARAGGERIEVYSTETGARVWTEEFIGVSDIARFSEDGKLVAACARNGTIRVWDHGAGSRMYEFSGGVRGRAGLAFADRFLYAWSPRKLVAWSLDDGRVAFSANESVDHIFKVGVGGRWAVWAGNREGRLLDLQRAQVRWRRAYEERAEKLLFGSTESSDAVVVMTNDAIQAWGFESGVQEFTVPLRGVSDFRLLGGKLFAVSGQKLSSWQRQKPDPSTEFRAPEAPLRDLALVPEQNLAVAAGRQGIVVVDLANPIKRQMLTGHERPVYCVAVTPDGETLASGSSDNTVRLWNVREGREVAKIEIATNPVHTVCFGPQGKRLAVGYGVDRLSIYDVNGLREQMSLEGHPSQVYDVAFAGDGTELVTGCQDGYVRLWDLNTGRVRTSAKAHGAGVTHVRYSADHQRILSGDREGTLVISQRVDLAERSRIAAHVAEITDLVLTGAAGYATSSADGSVRLWDDRTGAFRGLVHEGTESIMGLGALYDRQTLLICESERMCFTSTQVFDWTRESLSSTVQASVNP